MDAKIEDARRILRITVMVLGGESSLARELEANPKTVADWLSSKQSPPDDVVLRAIDVLLRHNSRLGKVLKQL
jgi:hypothetical protein